eukprot:CAMPEP_0179968476 /NCGR_PEP_ID=MMETSP0983-20121128/33894_1 /TAXON_ID=483367 /ORGANISM="non described non described, Strain CCMP 2436" /LENGTH=32 /DNA_ID= /DNA_START= /DNA_END= /DNA_ORIENTATION=
MPRIKVRSRHRFRCLTLPLSAAERGGNLPGAA